MANIEQKEVPRLVVDALCEELKYNFEEYNVPSDIASAFFHYLNRETKRHKLNTGRTIKPGPLDGEVEKILDSIFERETEYKKRSIDYGDLGRYISEEDQKMIDELDLRVNRVLEDFYKKLTSNHTCFAYTLEENVALSKIMHETIYSIFCVDCGKSHDFEFKYDLSDASFRLPPELKDLEKMAHRVLLRKGIEGHKETIREYESNPINSSDIYRETLANSAKYALEITEPTLKKLEAERDREIAEASN